MNKLELESVSILKDLVENFGVVGIKTSFEDEGASLFEVTRLKELCNQSGTKLLLKIAGAEAKRDLVDSLSIGVKGIVAPMIETPFALDKYMNSVKSIFSNDIISSIQFGINIESYTSYKNFEEISKADGFEQLYHVTVGRVDFVSSMGKDRDYANSDEMYDIVNDVFKTSKSFGKKVYLGGAVTTDSFNFFNKLFTSGLLDKFETRYVIYDPTIALKSLEESLKMGQKLELNILEYRRNYYLNIANKEIDRIKMIESRIGNN